MPIQFREIIVDQPTGIEMNKSTIEKILDAAISAPSGDNIQPWRFELAHDYTRINLFNLPEKDDSYYNYQQTASYIAHGAVIENIAIAARHLGCKAEIALFPETNNPQHVARIELSPVSPEADPLYAAIFNRYTNRFAFQPIELAEADIKKLSASVQAFDNVRAYFVHQRRQVKKLAAVLMLNDRLVFERQDMHRYLFSTVRWNQTEIENSGDGMPVATLGLNPLEKPFFPLMRFWRVVRAANYVGLSRVIGIKCWNNCRNAALLGEITVKQADNPGFVQAGRAMQRVWLEATRQGLAFQPIIGLPLLIYRLKQNALQAFSANHRQLLRQAEKAMHELFEIEQAETMIVGFRIGVGQAVAARTQRKPI